MGDGPAPGTRIEVETETGNSFQSITRYLLTNGKEVTKAAYDAAKKRNRGDIIEEEVRDASWSRWSEPHRFSGQDFTSPSPRSWLRARVHLLSDNPEASVDERGRREHYVWDGQGNGGTVPPGVYIVQIQVPADAGSKTVQRLVHVVY